MSTPRIHVEGPLRPSLLLSLPPAGTRHVQVLRLQPGAAVTLFDGLGGEWAATVERIERQAVAVRVRDHRAIERELPLAVTLALGMPANDRMDTLVEKATELGVTTLQPLVSERSVLRLEGERAERRRAHWQAVAAAACEQSGRNRLPRVAPVRSLRDWLEDLPADGALETRWVLTFADDADELGERTTPDAITVLSGPEGGLSAAEERAARERGFVPLTLGPRVLRADTAPLAILAWLALQPVRTPGAAPAGVRPDRPDHDR